MRLFRYFSFHDIATMIHIDARYVYALIISLPPLFLRHHDVTRYQSSSSFDTPPSFFAILLLFAAIRFSLLAIFAATFYRHCRAYADYAIDAVFCFSLLLLLSALFDGAIDYAR